MDEFSMTVRQAIVLAAGNGDRFRDGSRHSKLLAPVGGIPLLVRTLESARRGGISDAHIVLGYDAASVAAIAERFVPQGLTLHFHYNDRWPEENGLSVLAARDGVDGRPFALMMGDHIFEPAVLRTLCRMSLANGDTLLGVDRRPCDPPVAAEATKVQLDGNYVRAIGKTLEPYDALDTGLFVSHASLFDALDASCQSGDSTLSAGVRRLAACRLVRGVDIGEASWFDIDTTDDLRAAERLLASPSQP